MIRALMTGALLLSFSCSTAPAHPWYNITKISKLNSRIDKNGRIALFELSGSLRPDEKNEPGSFIPEDAPVLYSGLDVISLDSFKLLKNRKFALLTNATGLNRNKVSAIELFLKSGVKPELLLEPEHGLFGYEDSVFYPGIRKDTKTGLNILSLYSKRRKPSSSDLEGIDLIVVDILNLPVRAYTYASTLIEIMEVAENNKIEVMILDRYNPYGLWESRGPLLNKDYTSFVGMAPVPFLYSLTLGELAMYMANVRFHEIRLSVVKVDGYNKKKYLYGSGVNWINPSPNIPAYDSALVYPGVVMFEGTNISLGRGTTRPFVYSGAPWMDSASVVAELRALNMRDVRFSEVVFRPNDSIYKGIVCKGVQITAIGRSFDTLRVGYEYMRIFRRLHPYFFRFKGRTGNYFTDRLWGSPDYREAIEADMNFKDFEALWKADEEEFRRRLEGIRLY